MNSDDDVSLDDVDLFDDTTVSRTEERPQNVKTSGKDDGLAKAAANHTEQQRY